MSSTVAIVFAVAGLLALLAATGALVVAFRKASRLLPPRQEAAAPVGRSPAATSA
jgi:hypothetical protein